MSVAAKKSATYADLEALPSNVVGEIVNGSLHASPRPASRHALASSILGEELGPPFRRGRGGPGGWILLDEPELHLGAHVLVPDLGGWTRERMPELPDVAFFTTPPDWVCEVLSPGTRRLDRAEKLPIYAKQGVSHAWLVDPDEQMLEVFRLDGTTYRAIATHGKADRVRAEPFEAFELDLALLWAR